MSVRLRSFKATAVAITLAAATAACSGGTATTSVAPTSGPLAGNVPTSPGPNLRAADREFIEVCKDYPSGTGPTVTFTVSADIDSNGSIDQTYQTTLDAGQCKDVWVSGGSIGDRVTVTETVPAGHTASFAVFTINGSTVTPGASGAGNSVTGLAANGTTGSLVIFTNTPNTPPPPPPGVAGCTPGYWKQSHHFDSWPAPYTPNMQFSAVFENAFPGMTLLDVVSQGGGGLTALGRHTVAALLSAGSVNYGMTPAQVIAAFNGVFPGGDYNTLHNQLEAFNERGCPLN